MSWQLLPAPRTSPTGLFSPRAICDTHHRPRMERSNRGAPIDSGQPGSGMKPRAARRKLPLGRGATLVAGDRTHIVGLADLSSTGAYLVTGIAASPGDEFSVRLFVLPGQSGLAVRVRVVRVVRGSSEQQHHRGGLAVEFLDLDEESRARIEGFVKAGMLR
jgi:hypothetical protein